MRGLGVTLLTMVLSVEGITAQQQQQRKGQGQGQGQRRGAVPKDTNEKCGFWASIGECEKNPTYMHKSCASSCSAAAANKKNVDSKARRAAAEAAARKQEAAEVDDADDIDPEADALAAIGGMQYSEVTCYGDGDEIAPCFGREKGDPPPFADRLVKQALAIANDTDCMEGVVDASHPSLQRNGAVNPGAVANEAARIFRKCRYVVVKNIIDKAILEKYQRELSAHIEAIRNGTLSLDGTTTFGEKYYLKTIGSDETRWLLLLPRSFVPPELVAPRWLIKLLNHPRILGEDFLLNDAGCALAEPGSPAQEFHLDDDYVYGTDSLAFNGVGGHDLPSNAVTVLQPLLDMRDEHGPTEFCMGTSALNGIEFMDPDREFIKSKKLRKLVGDTYAVNPGKRPSCVRGEGGAMRSDALSLGDVAIFDYQIVHRGGANQSPDMRALLYFTYSRKWYKDRNFDEYGGGKRLLFNTDFVVGEGASGLSEKQQMEFMRITKKARFAVMKEGGGPKVEDEKMLEKRRQIATEGDLEDEEPPAPASDNVSEGGTEPAPSPDEAGACESREPPPLSSYRAPLFKFDPSDP